MRKKRRRTEIQQVKRENNQYLLQVEKAKTHKRLQEKRKRTLAEAGEPVPEEKPDDETSQLEKMRNRFRQRGVSREENEDIDELLPSKKGQHGGPRKRQRVDRKRQAAEDVRADHSSAHHRQRCRLRCSRVCRCCRSPCRQEATCPTTFLARYAIPFLPVLLFCMSTHAALVWAT